LGVGVDDATVIHRSLGNNNHRHRAAERGVYMTGFHGWEAGALWEDVKFDIKHFADIERLAMVGDKKWQHGMAAFCKPFTKATIRYFDHAEAAEARTWLGEA
jgi:SpoIIAA-like